MALRRKRPNTRRLARALRLARLAQWELSLETGRFRWSDEVTAIFGIPTKSEDGGISAVLLWVHPEDRLMVARALLDGAPHRMEYRLVLPDGSLRTIHQEAEIDVDKEGAPSHLVGSAQDVTELRDAERQIRNLAYFDNLTRLPNRVLLRRFLERTVRESIESRAVLAVLAIDLDGFKRVNDSLGHTAGDELLQEVSRRLLGAVHEIRPNGGVDDPTSFEQHVVADTMVARLGGDEFVVVLSDLTSVSTAERVARRVGQEVARCFSIAGSEAFISASIGIACAPIDGTTGEELLERADFAMYHVKEHGRDAYSLYDTGQRERMRRRAEIEAALRRAMSRTAILPGATLPPAIRPELFLAYQPKVEIPARKLVGAEALLRLVASDIGPISPAEFIPIAEETGLIVPLGEWVLEQACRQSNRWAAEGLPHVRVAVNVSARQFKAPDFVERVGSILARTCASPDRIELELTESMVMNDAEGARPIIERLKALGVRIALDDFGTGYSSLSQLAKLPVDTLKIDRSFVIAVENAPKVATITSAIIAMSRGLAMDVVVEGVETQNQLDFFARHGKVEIQGYIFAKPMPPENLRAWQPPAVPIERPSLRVQRLLAAGE